MSEVIMDGALRLWCLDGDTTTQELAVAKGDSAESIDTYFILVNLTDLNDDTCLVPRVAMWTFLVLNTYLVADCKRW